MFFEFLLAFLAMECMVSFFLEVHLKLRPTEDLAVFQLDVLFVADKPQFLHAKSSGVLLLRCNH